MRLKPLSISFFCAAAFFLFSGLVTVSDSPDLLDLMKQSQDKLNADYALDADKLKMKKAEIQLTRDGFFRCRRTFISGKQEYYSFSFSAFEELNYLGNEQNGWVVLKVKPEGIIVQTFRDPKGNIDTMATQLRLPFKNLEAADLHMLNDCFQRIREKLTN